MSKGRLRTEKICLNCGTEITDRFCPHCGQENIEPKQSVWHLINHFFSDITHFDGKFFITVKDLFAKPGFLSKEYMAGRRASYLDPIRMYVFTSAIFFLIFFSMVNVNTINFQEGEKTLSNDSTFKKEMQNVAKVRDSLRTVRFYRDTMKAPVAISIDTGEHHKGLRFGTESGFQTVAAYDSFQRSLPAGQRDGWMKRSFKRKAIEMNERLETEKGSLVKELINTFLHSFPKILFVFLPIFALILKLLYVRHRSLYYTDHGIFSIHLFIFSFLCLLGIFALTKFRSVTGWEWTNWLIVAAVLYPFVYFYKAMRRFYGQRRLKTFLKYSILFVISFFLMTLIFVAAIGYTVYEV